MTLPSVAAAHLIYQIIHFPGSSSEIFTPNDESLQQYIAVIEASLNICDTFANWMALGLFALAFYRVQFKRAVTVVIVGLFAFVAQLLLFFQPGASNLASNSFTRPFLINVPAIVVTILTLVTLGLIFGLLGIYQYFRTIGSPDVTQDRIQNQLHVEDAQLQGDIHTKEFQQMMEITEQMKKECTFMMRVLAGTKMAILPIHVALCLSVSLGAFGVTPGTLVRPFGFRFRFFIPESNHSFTELDQAVAVGGGFTTLLFSLYSAWKSRNSNNEE
jgi:hypothetical protein